MDDEDNAQPAPSSLLHLPGAAVLLVLRSLDARSLAALEQTARVFSRRDPVTRLPLTEHIARQLVLRGCGGDAEAAERFRHHSWKERLHLETTAGVGFDRAWCEEAGFRFSAAPGGARLAGVRLVGMGPKLLLSSASTADQPVLRWRLRVRGNTAVEFGVVPVALAPAHAALHKCLAARGAPAQRCMGFCSQITAGSLLPLKAPVMRGTVIDLVARRGRVEALLRFPPDAREISWQDGQPVQRAYRGPSALRFEQDFPAGHDVRLAVTAWAKASFEILHAGVGLEPEWAAACAAADAEMRAHAAARHAAAAAAAAGPLLMAVVAAVDEPAAAPAAAAAAAAPVDDPMAVCEPAPAPAPAAAEEAAASSGEASPPSAPPLEPGVCGAALGAALAGLPRSESSAMLLDGHIAAP